MPEKRLVVIRNSAEIDYTQHKKHTNQEVIETLPGRSDKIIDIIMDITYAKTRGNFGLLCKGLLVYVLAFQVLAIVIVTLLTAAGAKKAIKQFPWQLVVHGAMLVPAWTVFKNNLDEIKANLGGKGRLFKGRFGIPPELEKELQASEGLVPTIPGILDWVTLLSGINQTNVPPDENAKVLEVQIDTGADRTGRNGEKTSFIKTHWNLTLHWKVSDDRVLDLQDAARLEKTIAETTATEVRNAVSDWIHQQGNLGKIQDARSINQYKLILQDHCLAWLKTSQSAQAIFEGILGVTITGLSVRDILLSSEIDEAEENVQKAKRRREALDTEEEGEVARHKKRTQDAKMSDTGSVVLEALSKVAELLRDIFGKGGGK
jgi:hypothetical protein